MCRFLLLLFSLLAGLGSAMAQNPVPLVNQPLVPADAAPGGAAFTLTVNGTGFASGTTVNWNGQPLSTTFVSPSQLAAAVPAAYIATRGTASVTVVNPGTAAASNVVFFPVAPARSLTSFAMTSASPMFGIAGTLAPPMAIGAADFNGDGKLDLALGFSPYPYNSGGPGSLHVLLGNGDGNFTILPSSSPTGTGPQEIALGDLNGDGNLDLAVVNSCATFEILNNIGNNVSILLGNGDGTFAAAPGSPVPVGSCPHGIVPADFNGDGKLDLAVSNWRDDTVSILLGNGDGTFTPAPGSPVPVGSAPMAMAAGDFNSDGRLDLAVDNYDDLSVSILLGNGNGAFVPAPGSPVSETTSKPPYFLAAGDFNSDGKLDLAVGGWFNQTVAVLLGDGGGTFTQIAGCCGVSQQMTIGMRAMVSADFYGNGKLDLGMADEFVGDYATTMRGNGDGTLTPSEFSVLMGPGTYSLAAGDFNGDGELDLAQTSNGLSVLLQALAPGHGPDITIAKTGSTSASVRAGETATFKNLQVFSLNGFTGAVTLSCSGAPRNSTCSVTPPSVYLSAGASFVSLKLSVQTTAPTLAGGAPPWSLGRWPLALWTLLLGLVFLAASVAARHRSARTCCLAVAPFAMLLICVILWAACGSVAPPRPVGGTPPGTYTLTVTATSGSITRSTTVTLTVQ